MGRLFDTKETSNSSKNSSAKTTGRLFKEPITEKVPGLGSKILSGGKLLAKAIVEPVATLAVRPLQAVAELSGASSETVDANTKKIFGDWVAPTPKNTSDVVKDVGRGIQTVALGTIPKIGVAGNIIGGGAAGGAGMALEQSGTDTTAKQLLKDTAIGAATGTALFGVGRLFKGKKIPSIDEVNIQKEVVQNSEVRVPTKEVEVPIEKPLDLSTIQDNTGRQDLRTVMTNLQQGGYSRTQVPKIMEKLYTINPVGRFTRDEVMQAIGETKPRVKVTMPGFVKENPNFVRPKTVQEVTQQVDTPTIQAANKTPIIDTAQESIQQPKMDIPDSVKNNIVSDLEKDFVDSTNFSRGTFKDWTDRIQQKDFNEVLDIATGKKQPIDDIPANAYYSVAKNIADETGDSRLIDELSNSNVSSKAGQELTTARLTNVNNTVDIIRDIKQTLAQKIKKNNGIDVEGEITKQSKVLDKLIEDVKTLKPSRETVSKILDNITC